MVRPEPGGPPRAAQWEQLLASARAGAPEMLGQLLEGCRQYLLLVANQELEPDLQGKVGPSDVVQETFLEAQRDFGGFRGSTEQELLAWLRRILLNNLAHLTRHYRDTQKRQLAREVPLAEAPFAELQHLLASAEGSPSTQALAREQAEALDRALERLPEHYRQVLLLRHQEQLSFEAIGQRLVRSAEAARKLWARAVEQLQQDLEPPHEPQG
jgi:RNA polymerase sigma-70 factor (ECF subfamily)